MQQYRDEKTQSTKVKLQEEEQEVKEVERKERTKFEEQVAKEKLVTEKALWMEQRRIMLETNEKEPEMERKARGAMESLPKLNINPFKGIPKDWPGLLISSWPKLITRL